MALVVKKYRIVVKEDLYKTKLGMVAVLISSAESFDSGNIGLCFDVMYSAKSFNDVLNSRLKRFYDQVNKEIDYYLRNLEHLAEFYPSANLIFYEINPKYNIKSPLCTLLGIRHPNKTILVVHSYDNIAAVSARRGDSNVAVNQLLQSAVKGIPGAGAGGHVPSAGAVVPGKYYKKFKKRVINLLEKR